MKEQLNKNGQQVVAKNMKYGESSVLVWCTYCRANYDCIPVAFSEVRCPSCQAGFATNGVADNTPIIDRKQKSQAGSLRTFTKEENEARFEFKWNPQKPIRN